MSTWLLPRQAIYSPDCSVDEWFKHSFLSDMEIRPYTETDEQEVVVLWETVFPNAPQWNRPEDDIRHKLAVQRELFFVAIEDSAVVGTAMAGYDGHRGWVYYVAVHPDFRKMGIGRALMEQAESGLVEIGCPKLNLQVRASDNEVLAFYKKLGYRVEARVSMGKNLPGSGGGER